MGQFKIHNVETAPADSQPVLQEIQKGMGFVPNLLSVSAESPVALKTYVTVSGLLRQSSLSETERQVVYLTTSFVNDCGYCMAAHSKLAKRFKVDPGVVQSLRQGTPLADKKLEALRQFTLAILRTKGFVTPSDLSAVTAAGYNQAQILDVIVCITLKTYTNLAAHVADIPLDEAFREEKWEHPKA